MGKLKIPVIDGKPGRHDQGQGRRGSLILHESLRPKGRLLGIFEGCVTNLMLYRARYPNFHRPSVYRSTGIANIHKSLDRGRLVFPLTGDVK